MEFKCRNCGHKLVVADTQAGKKGRCPNCKEVQTVPHPTAEQGNPLYNRELLEAPEPRTIETPAPAETDMTEAAYEQLRGALGGRLMEPEEIPQRRYPWILDIFLYPLNSSALQILLICVGIPFLLRVLLTFFKALTIHIPVMLIGWVLSLVLHWAVLAILLLYVNWYIFECLRDSAQGRIRAPETGAATPGLGELLTEGFRLIVCALLCMAPAFVYRIRNDGIDPLFWVLYGMGGFVFPMALLAVVIYESLRGANPILIVRSILCTFFRYCVLVPFCYVLCLMFPLAFSLLLNRRYWHWSYVLQAVAFYLLLIMAHLLGRFHFKYDEQLYWDT